MYRKMLILVSGLLLVAAACGGGSSDEGASPDDDGHGHIADSTTTMAAMPDDDHDDGHDDGSDGHGEDFAWGRPADAHDATRVIEIDGGDDFRFHPDTITVEVGDIVTFRATNTGSIPHEIVLGSAEEQEEHAAEMADMADGAMMEHDEANELELAPGETAELTFEFTQAGTLLLGCHEPGHYEAGMVGTLVVTA